MSEFTGELDEKTVARLSREWDKLPREEGSGTSSVSASIGEKGDIIVVRKNMGRPDEQTQIITEEGRTSDLN